MKIDHTTTRFEVIELRYQVAAVIRKAQCRAEYCHIIDLLDEVEEKLESIDEELTEIIGD